MYNIFTHYLVTYLYRDLTFDEKYSKSNTLIIIIGILGIIISKMMLKKKIIIKKGIIKGSYLLIITGILSKWTIFNEEFKVLITGGIFIYLLWISYKKEKKIKKLKKK